MVNFVLPKAIYELNPCWQGLDHHKEYKEPKKITVFATPSFVTLQADFIANTALVDPSRICTARSLIDMATEYYK